MGIADWGPLVLTDDIDSALIATLELWLPTYLGQAAIDKNLDYALPLPKSYDKVLTDDEFMDHSLPAVLVTTAKTTKTDGGKQRPYMAEWRTVVSVILRGRTPGETKFNASVFEGAVRRLVLQKGAQDGGPINDIKWVDTEVAPVRDQTTAGRYLAAGIGTYNVFSDAAAQASGGPDVPNSPPYVPLAVVTEVDISVQAESED